MILGFHYHGLGSVPAWGTEILQATQHGPEKGIKNDLNPRKLAFSFVAVATAT